MNRLQSTIIAAALALTVSMSVVTANAAVKEQTIYSNTLQNGWQPWGWATIDYGNHQTVHPGSASSIAVTVKKGYDALYVHHTAFNTSTFHALTFWVNGGAKGGQVLQIQATANKKPVKYFKLAVLPAHRWIKESIPLSSLGAAGRKDVDGFWIEDGSGKPLPTFYVDDIELR